jgi:hypothetical protein
VGAEEHGARCCRRTQRDDDGGDKQHEASPRRPRSGRPRVGQADDRRGDDVEGIRERQLSQSFAIYRIAAS